MAKNLVIVESPTKVKTIKKFLGANYDVMASNGHVRDLPKSQMGFSPETGYEPKYITIRGKGEVLAALRKAAKKADRIYLATDPDREGEAISWHLAAALKLEDKDIHRITFNEITKTAVKEALKHSRPIDLGMVDAQQTRRMLDRMVGYRISPLLWEKIKRGLSAGRVQSVALRIIADREDEINAFIPQEFWTLEADFLIGKGEKPLRAKFYGNNKKITISSKEGLDQILKELENVSFTVKEIKRGERSSKAPLPFTTSTLQQEAAKQLNFSTQKTMRIAQQLYEGIELKKEGLTGLITYLRTDSTRISDEADRNVREFIRGTWDESFVTDKLAQGGSAQKIQDAHEAVRPSDVFRTPDSVKDVLSRDQFRLYQLIWKRFVASRMAAAKYETTAVVIAGGSYSFHVSASRMLFEGYKAVYTDEEENADLKNRINKGLEEGMELELKAYDYSQHFTQPPAHYTEASLVKTLEEKGIGRPSTYAPIITTLLARRYVLKEQKNLYMSELGEAVNSMMKTAFPTIVDVAFTANMESLLDAVGEGSLRWKDVVENFYPDLDVAVKEAEKSLEKVSVAEEVSNVICENCGRNMVVKYGPHGKFLACPGFPDCKNTKPYLEKAGVSCPVCGKEVIIRKTKKGRRYYGCENPDCKFMAWQKPSAIRCPECGGYMLEKGSKLMCADSSCGYLMSVKDANAKKTDKEP